MAKIKLAKTAGFCFGVNRAVELVYKLLDEGKNVCTLGPIIHNPQMVSLLADKGVHTLSSHKDAKEGDTLVIRSHGVPRDIYNEIDSLGVSCADATCPFVAKIHKLADKNTSEDIPLPSDPTTNATFIS